MNPIVYRFCDIVFTLAVLYFLFMSENENRLVLALICWNTSELYGIQYKMATTKTVINVNADIKN